MLRRWFLVFALAAMCSKASAGGIPICCLDYPIFHEPPYMWFIAYEYPCRDWVVDCNNPISMVYASTDDTFDGWPENCPYCEDSAQEPDPQGRYRGLRNPIDRCASLCCLVPNRVKTRDGVWCNPRRGVTVLGCRNIQVRGENGRMISVRLFEARLSPRAAGLPKGKDRIVLIGFESDRPVSPTCRPCAATVNPQIPYQAQVRCCGKTYTILTHSPLRDVEGAAQNASQNRPLAHQSK